jgi:MFS family permease
VHLTPARRGVIAGCAFGVASSWNVGNVGAVASDLARAYDVALVTVGLLTTALFVTHTAIQIPGGKAADRFGPARAGAAALLFIGAGDVIALVAPDPVLAVVARAVTGLGTGLGFVSGSALVRETGGSAFAQGLFGGIGLSAAGLALAVVPQFEGALGWRAPYWTSLVVAAAALAVLLVSRTWRLTRERRVRAPRGAAGVLRDRRLYRLALLYTTTYGLSVVIGNWVIEILQRHSTLSKGAAAVIGALTLLLTVVSRPLGGWIQRTHPHRMRLAVGAGLVAGALGTVFLLVADPGWLAAVGGVMVGIGAGLSFAPAFAGAADVRPDAPAASVGLVNAIANFAILVGTPLVGLSFSAAGEGRLGFAVLAGLWLVGLAALPTASVLGADARAPAVKAG